MPVLINDNVIGGERISQWYYGSSAIINSGGSQLNSNIVINWWKFRKNADELEFSFRYQFNSTFGTANQIILVKLPVFQGIQLNINSGIAFMTAAPLSFGNLATPWFAECVATLGTGGSMQQQLLTWGGGTLNINSSLQYLRFVNVGFGQLLDTAVGSSGALHVYNAKVPILEFR
jgi:hypothetical protein